MSLINIDGIVTRYANYKENDRILTIFTKEYGSVSACARGCRRPGSALLACSELFVFGEFVLFSNKDKYSVNSSTAKETFYPLREDVDRFAAGMYMLELINAGSEVTQQSDEVFSLLYHALSYACYGDCAPVDIALCFAAKFLSALGYAPVLTRCAVCGMQLKDQKQVAFCAASGGAVCSDCERGAMPVSALSLEAIRRMLRLSHDEINKVRLPERVRHELKPILNAHAEYVLERRFKAIEQLSISHVSEPALKHAAQVSGVAHAQASSERGGAEKA